MWRVGFVVEPPVEILRIEHPRQSSAEITACRVYNIVINSNILDGHSQIQQSFCCAGSRTAAELPHSNKRNFGNDDGRHRATSVVPTVC